MKSNKKKYVSPIVETMNCKVERGFQSSGFQSNNFDGGMLEGITDGGGANNLFN